MRKYSYRDSELQGLEWALPFSLADMVATVAILLGLVFVLPGFTMGILHLFDAPQWLILGAGGATVVAAILWIFPKINSPRGWGLDRWLMHFWWANVIGHARWWGFDYRGEIVMVDKVAGVKPVVDVRFWLVVPWGGWFKKSRFVWEATNPANLLWKSQIKAAHGSSRAELVDIFGNRVTLPIETIFHLIHSPEWGTDNNLKRTIESMFSRLAHREAKLAESRAWATENFRRANAFTKVVDETIDKIRDTQRFVSSAQAWDILKWLVAKMLELLPENDELRQKYEHYEMPPQPKRKGGSRRAKVTT